MIRELDSHLINQIAAGEVVESPHSVVKELVENAIDAHAKKIEVRIEKGGKSLIQVIDDGDGISNESLLLAFKRHATSKISNINDLQSLVTLGFRGEALPSIAGVSKMTFVSKTADAPMGGKIEVQGKDFSEISPIATTNGSLVEVRELFFNMPVRRQYMKSDSQEGARISDLMQSLALANPHIAFVYIRDGKKIFQTTGKNDVKTTFYQIFGNEILSFLLPIEYEEATMHISGLIGKPEIARGNRQMEHFFIHHRAIKSNLLQTAVEDAYKTRLPIGRFPVVVLFLEISLQEVDVNVHPQKLEVRFAKEEEIYDFVFKAVSDTLTDAFLIQEKRPKSTFPSPRIEENALDFSIPAFDKTKENRSNFPSYKQTNHIEDDVILDYTPVIETLQNGVIEPYIVEEMLPAHDHASDATFKKADTTQSDTPFSNYRIIGQVFGTYWIIEEKEDLFFIDQHAAHERILYEWLLDEYTYGDMSVQHLLEPYVLNLSDSEVSFLSEHLEHFKRFGYQLELFSEDVYGIRSLPYIFDAPISPSFFVDMIQQMMEKVKKESTIYEFFIEDIAKISCVHAIRANEPLASEEVVEMIHQLLHLKNPFTCPHGRPTMYKISENELKKNFLRVMS